MRKLTVFLVISMLLSGVSSVQARDYRIGQKKPSLEDGRKKLYLSIQTDKIMTGESYVKMMMDAVLETQKETKSDIVTIYLENLKGRTIGTITYSADGCDWNKRSCNEPLWANAIVYDPRDEMKTLINGPVPVSLRHYGDPKRKAEFAKADACRNDLHCWSNKWSGQANAYCAIKIQGRALYGYKWMTRKLFETKFTKAKWRDKNKGSLSYWGNKLKFKNMYGIWAPMKYVCHFEPHSKVAEVQIGVR